MKPYADIPSRLLRKLVTAFYLSGRIRFVREATAGQRFLDSSDDDEVVRALAALEMRSVGLRPRR